ncbi:hypothetical protein IQ250_06270 [Pseudanabaenaceae cyanobacterium LEGE 13415]|nr:hypothetical protein [Pseudanabaenaceae cyanobacterium LEGE 13415]
MISTVAPQDTQNLLHSSVQSFFATCNWENKTLAPRSMNSAIEQLEQAAAVDSITELSFDLRVRQFFAAVNWDGSAIASSPAIVEEPISEPDDGFTLTDFSDLF